jgi:acetylornithine/N-succinyldiaminopimelate aminotransferase
MQTPVLKMFPSPGVTLTALETQGTKIRTKEYGTLTDFSSGCWAAVLGHCRQEIIQVIMEYAGKLLHTHQYFDTEQPAALVNELASAAVLHENYAGTFLSSGSDAVALGILLSELLTGKKKKLCFSISGLGSAAELRQPRNPAEWVDLQVMECLHCNKSCSCGVCGKFSAADFSEIACFVFEPGNAGGMVLCPPEKLIAYLSERVRASGSLILANEVTTGFGRTGKWFGFQHYNCLGTKGHGPDFIALGKGLGNGYPVSGLLVKQELAEQVAASGFKFVQSHINDPLGCAIAREVVRIMRDENLVEHGNEAGAYLRQRLEETAKKSGGITEIRGRGMMNVFVLHDTFKSAEVFRKLLECGFFTEYAESQNLIRLYAPLITEDKDIDRFCKSLKQILRR